MIYLPPKPEVNLKSPEHALLCRNVGNRFLDLKNKVMQECWQWIP